MADMGGPSPGTISKIEGADPTVGIRSLQKLAEVTGWTFSSYDPPEFDQRTMIEQRPRPEIESAPPRDPDAALFEATGGVLVVLLTVPPETPQDLRTRLKAVAQQAAEEAVRLVLSCESRGPR